MTIHLIRDLESLHRDVLSMCASVEEIIHKAVDELGQPGSQLAGDLSKQDDEIDRWDVKIEEECLKLLALHQPVAIDLRRIAAVLKITGELERVADLGVHIAERSEGLVGFPNLRVPDRLKQMAQVALDMLHRSIDSYVELDSKVARNVIREDDLVDEMNREIINELVETMKRSPDLIDPAMHLFSASRHIERVADHATNIAEDVVYLVEGAIIRHGIDSTELGSLGAES
jgi:phosphate transport system protein